MGVYRSIVETEEVVHLDDDNNVDLKEIDKIVADHDANADEQERAQDAEYADPGTEDSVEDIMEESYMAIYEFENENAKIMRAIGLHELNESVAGRDFIFEAEEDKEAFFTRVIEKIKAFFKKAYETLQKWYRKIAAILDYNAKIWKKDQAKIKAGYEACRSKEAPELYPFDKLPIVDPKDSKADAKANDFEIDKSKWTEDGCKEIIKELQELYLGRPLKEDESFATALKAEFCGTKAKAWMSIEDIETALTKSQKAKQAVNDFKAVATKQVKTHIKNIQRMKDEAKKAENVDKDFMASCTRACGAIQKIVSTIETYRVVYCSCINLQATQARKVANIYVKAANAKKEEEKPAPKAESTEFGFLGKFL